MIFKRKSSNNFGLNSNSEMNKVMETTTIKENKIILSEQGADVKIKNTMRKLTMLFGILLCANTICLAQTTVTNEGDAKYIFKLIFDASDPEIESLGTITQKDLNTATLLLKELATKSAELKLTSNFIKITNPSVASIFVSIVKSLKEYNSSAGEGKYNEACRVTLKRNWKTSFESRKQLREWL